MATDLTPIYPSEGTTWSINEYIDKLRKKNLLSLLSKSDICSEKMEPVGLGGIISQRETKTQTNKNEELASPFTAHLSIQTYPAPINSQSWKSLFMA